MKQSLPEKRSDSSILEKLKKLGSGSVLLAREVLQDPNFESTIVLVCIHSTEGSYGLVMNRPSHMPLSEIFDGFSSLRNKREVYIGGPVQQDELQILQITNEPVEGAYEIAPGVHMGGRWGSIGHMIETDSASTYFFLGYSGWGSGQLEAEVRAGAWDVFRIDIEKLLTNLKKLASSDKKEISEFFQSIQI